MAETAAAAQAEKLYDRRIYDIWYHMMRRCSDPADAHYSYYGGRGITVCDEWHSYHAFARWARASGYEEYLTIDRINNDDGYSPDNCRWATYQAQANNRRSSRRITAAGRTMTHAQWAQALGVTRQAIAWAVRRGIAPEYIEAHLAAGPGERVVCRHMPGYTPRRAGGR